MNRLALGMFTQALVISFCLIASVSLDSAVALDSIEESSANQRHDSKIQRKKILSKTEIEPAENLKVRKIRSALAKISNKSENNNSEKNLSTIGLEQKHILGIALPESETEQEFSTTRVTQSQLKSREFVAPTTINSVNKNIETEIEIKTETETVLEKTSDPQHSTVLVQNLADPNPFRDRSVEESLQEVENVERQLRDLEKVKIRSYYSSPALSVYVPVGYGSEQNTGFVAASYQGRTRFANKDDGAIGFGVGLGNSKKSVGVVISYTMASFGGSRDFGSGGFNLKVHRQFKGEWAAAVGMNGFLNIGDYNDSDIDGINDFENSLYAVATKIFRTRDDINKPLSRVAVTAGIGNGQFRTENAINNDEDNFNVFGSVAVRVHPQASLIAEWTGQDLALGASIAPFKNLPLVITPAIRDIAGPGAGASDGARFILGTGFGFKF